ncbi:MAG TPA: glycoside hydrolase family 52 protein [Fimbriimonadaceae bacterium]|jgi:hypothetical protein
MDDTIFFNAHHSPIGAFSTLTLGCKGSRGGFGCGLKGPADESVFVGIEEERRPGMFKCLPFFDGSDFAPAPESFDVEGLSDHHHPNAVLPFFDSDITRKLGAASDIWSAGDLTFSIYNQVTSIPDPATADPVSLRKVCVPALIVELKVDNSKGVRPRKAFFGFAGSDRRRAMRPIDSEGLVGVAQGRRTGIATAYKDSYAGIGLQPESVLNPKYSENLLFTIGGSGLIVVTVPPGCCESIRFAVGFFEDGIVTTGIDTSYLYTTLFSGLEEVLSYALTQADRIIKAATEMDSRILEKVGPVRALTIGHAIKSYYGNTQLLVTNEGAPIWVVNEGEYRMMNTFDLTVDQLYLELALNPWTVSNVLDLYAGRYSYIDDVRFPTGQDLYPGGLAFAHDMGVANHFSPPGRSSYELAGYKGVFSYMSCEELVNWILCVCIYASHTRDAAWLKSQAANIASAVESLVNRDDPDSSKRNGVMSLDSARCKEGAEITTYDSLDASLGQARNNIYLAVKTWAAYALVEEHLTTLGANLMAEVARAQSKLCAATLCSAADADGFLPAVIGEGVNARIIPAIEGLVYPLVAGRSDLLSRDGPFKQLRQVLETHFENCLVPGICLFDDGGWKLSSTSKNSWLSKIYLCQFVSEVVFGRAIDSDADETHWNWLMDEDNGYYAWSDQMVAGKAHGSRYYPRGVTAALWLSEPDRVLKSITELLTSATPFTRPSVLA